MLMPNCTNPAAQLVIMLSSPWIPAPADPQAPASEYDLTLTKGPALLRKMRL